ncbi:unnamed protein product [Vitrella brassicaformis CCMP3155]|uniref:Uncharacterized protein n=2 Tax=Vitrella brassicaformis TaxID=1169539 RepID=A0A0G4F719_VITBC|nr:unnamed protein product [Vitrella brassicaformis CCMP3155]|eukprot:CEM07809.1 unnamed protein product [Vitrella brassicaformis CCMP3155]
MDVGRTANHTTTLAVRTKERDALRAVWDEVREVSLICAEAVKKSYGEAKEAMYRPWLHAAFTKLHALNLTQFDKIMLLDADTLVNPFMVMKESAARIQARVEKLFSVRTPAGLCSDTLGGAQVHGTPVSEEQLKDAKDKGWGMRGCIMALKPSRDLFDNCLGELSSVRSLVKGRIGRYGDKDKFIGPDELFFSTVLQDWHHLTPNACVTSWHLKEENETKAFFLHIVSEKVFMPQFGKRWPDYDFWLKWAIQCRDDHPETRLWLGHIIERTIKEPITYHPMYRWPFDPLDKPIKRFREAIAQGYPH